MEVCTSTRRYFTFPYVSPAFERVWSRYPEARAHISPVNCWTNSEGGVGCGSIDDKPCNHQTYHDVGIEGSGSQETLGNASFFTLQLVLILSIDLSSWSRVRYMMGQGTLMNIQVAPILFSSSQGTMLPTISWRYILPMQRVNYRRYYPEKYRLRLSSDKLLVPYWHPHRCS